MMMKVKVKRIMRRKLLEESESGEDDMKERESYQKEVKRIKMTSRKEKVTGRK